MADISMCSGIAATGGPCPLRDGCYRYTAKHNPHWQSYLTPRVQDGKCEDHWPVKTPHSDSGGSR